MDNFNQEQLDVLGTSAINTTFTLLGYCRPYINTADKKPIWDGELFVYKTAKDFSKTNLDFIIPLQVKTSFHNKKNFPKQSKHKVLVSELKAYLEDRGVLFLTVLVNNEGGNQIYCGYLTKSEIRKYITKAKKHDSITIYFQKLPKSFKAFYDELYTLHLQRQLNSISVEELKNLKNTTYKFSVRHLPANVDIIKHIAFNPVDVLVECDGFSDPLYLGDSRALLKFSEIVEKSISVGGVVYYNSFTKTPSEKGYIIAIGKSTTLTIIEDSTANSKYTFNVSVTASHDGTICDLIHELKFIISSFENKGFFIDSHWHSYPQLLEENRDVINAWKTSLTFWENVIKLFDCLGIQEQLDINQLDDKNYKDLQTLIDAFIFDKRVIGVERDSHTVTFSIGNINILVFAEHLDGKYFKLRNLFDGLIVSMSASRTNRDKRIVISPFMIPYMPLLKNIPDNLPIEKLKQSYENIMRFNPNISDYAIENLLSMLLAYDKTKRTVHLKGASILAKWILENFTSSKTSSIHKLNLYQTFLRERPLNNEELDDLADIAVDSQDKSIRIAANALLGNAALVKRMWYNLKKPSQKDLSSRPIFNFIKPYI